MGERAHALVVLTPAEGEALARLAAQAVAARLTAQPLGALPPLTARLREPGASFVTLERHGRLRGCIGALWPALPLYQDVIRNAERAMRDPRLPPVTADEWPSLDVKVSVLGPLEAVPATSRDELLGALRPGIDGLILADGHRRATFLPAVWEKIPHPAQFVSALLAKGGWPDQGWPAKLSAQRYTSAEFHDPSPRPALAG